MKYLFGDWDKIKQRLSSKFIFLFLDFDGTLSPIVDTPDKALLPEKTKEILQRLSVNSGLQIALISGRSLEDLKNKVKIGNIIYVGNHGLEVEGPKLKFSNPLLPQIMGVLKKIKQDLQKKLFLIKGVLLEDKLFSLSIHYRLVNKKNVALVKDVVKKSVVPFLAKNKISLRSGKKVLEVRPNIKWDKGRIVLWLLARKKICAIKAPIMPVYIGDDLTDEDAFKALENKGITIFVGKIKSSNAQYCLRDSQEVYQLLKRIQELCPQ